MNKNKNSITLTLSKEVIDNLSVPYDAAIRFSQVTCVGCPPVSGKCWTARCQGLTKICSDRLCVAISTVCAGNPRDYN